MLDLAARLALRSAGDVEPNPLVGAVVARDGRVIGMGHHRRFGSQHAEREALDDCRRRGIAPMGATMYATLEPCRHEGKQPPCVEAILEAGIPRVVIALADPNPLSGGGAGVLRDAGIEVQFCDESSLATQIAEPFVKRITTGLPWVIAKWAQTIDGRIATRTGRSRWISGPRARRRVHRLRARVDAIVTGIGTVRADDPLLTARDVPRVRRVARRVVVDRDLELPADSALVRTAGQTPLIVACTSEAAAANPARRQRLTDAGARILPVKPGRHGLDLRELLRLLVEHDDATNVLIEAGPGLLGSFFEADLIDLAIVHQSPLLLGDESAPGPARGQVIDSLSGALDFELRRAARVGRDVELVYRRRDPPAPATPQA